VAQQLEPSPATSLVDGQHEHGLDRLDDNGIGDWYGHRNIPRSDASPALAARWQASIAASNDGGKTVVIEIGDCNAAVVHRGVPPRLSRVVDN